MGGPPTALSRGSSCYSSRYPDVPQLFHLYGREYSFGDLTGSQLIHLPSLNGSEGSTFPGSASPSDMAGSKSMVIVKPGGPGVVIGYQADEFTSTRSAECFIAQSHIYPSFMGMVSTLTHFSLEQGL